MRASEVAKAISRIIALALNLEVDFFDRQEMLGKPIATLRLLHYEGRVFDSMKWEFVAPLKGAFVVNLGDMLERWSNCIFRSTLHRVLGNGHERYSIAYFVDLVTIVLLNACPPANRKRTLPSFLLSNVKLTCSSGTRILMLFPSHTKIDSPNSVVNITGIFASSVEHRG
ncbi:hypothetical protein TEA_024145 [Camellia sinensis var. sinensis]|uniref:Isopenicillin N synthase-like Fe(2+) 2OG dioxygenase domain-containing protein n=1 Tax=Camellia sinensis var. sinensis TaxID=542762 RepID=A0A4S4EMS9_CAMSN|nr:hypothetical protein TEA_024145 [Camellia sinensis var. sinensis]